MERYKEPEEIKIKNYKGESVSFVEASKVKEGVVCDVYTFQNDTSKDLGIVNVKAGKQTPLQKVLSGDKTIEIFEKGKGTLRITDEEDKMIEYKYPGGPEEVVVGIGELMQWEAESDLTFAEICYPPYEDGRFENID